MAVGIFLLAGGFVRAQPVPGSYYDFMDAVKDMPAGHDKTSLIIYRQDKYLSAAALDFLRLVDTEERTRFT